VALITPTERAELLVVSDLHLGSALRAPFDFSARRRLVALDRAVERFVEHHRLNPPTDARWTLVLNGDTFDFMHIDLRPETDTSLSADERVYGMEYTSARARWKLAVIAQTHRRAFRALGRFLADGHSLVFVVGNHDADLSFRRVRQELRAHIAAEVPHAQRRAVMARISVSRWFYWAPTLAYVEHGHRFDPYTTFDDPLVPRAFGQATRLAHSFVHLSSRFFANRVRTLPLHDLDTWSMGDFWRWARRKGNLPLSVLAREYLALGWRCARIARETQRRLRERLVETQRIRHRRLRVFSRLTRLPKESLERLEAMGVAPISTRVWGVMQALYMGHVGVGLLAIVLALGSELFVEGLAARLLAPLGVLLGMGVLLRLLSALRPTSDAHDRLAHAARRVFRFTAAPVVVFGHTHRAVEEALSAEPTRGRGARRVRSPDSARTDDGIWLNPGAWEHAWRRPASHDDGCTCGLRFAHVARPIADERVQARLVQWCAWRGRPVTPTG
jgi:UDP-2,3-diacylglucosamine pyrophosphatase LpxH